MKPCVDSQGTPFISVSVQDFSFLINPFFSRVRKPRQVKVIFLENIPTPKKKVVERAEQTVND